MNPVGQLLDLLHESTSTVAFTGAGVSTASGIRDFRGKNGVYRDTFKGYAVEELFGLPLFEQDPSIFYEWSKDHMIIEQHALWGDEATADRPATYTAYLADPLHGVCEPSWICLDMKVLRENYSVTVPDRAYAYFNCFTTGNTPEKVMNQMKGLASRALAETSAQLAESCEALTEMGFDKTQVYTTLELRMKCGVGKCGRCNIGSKYVCKDGPVFRCDEIDELPPEY